MSRSSPPRQIEKFLLGISRASRKETCKRQVTIMKTLKTYRSMYAVCLALLLALNSFSPLAHAQLTRSTVLGTVTDTTDAVMVGAQVTLRNLATGTGRQVSTDESGVYRFLGVEPGDYSIEFARPGFQTRRVVSFRVGTAQEVGINQALPVNPVVSQ